MGARKNFIEKYISEQYGGTVAYMFANAPTSGFAGTAKRANGMPFS